MTGLSGLVGVIAIYTCLAAISRCTGDLRLLGPSVSPRKTIAVRKISREFAFSDRRSKYLCGLACMFVLVTCASCSAANSKHPSNAIRQEQIHFSSGDIKLAGTLVIPAAPGPYPAIVLFHGSGYEERNLSMAHWFAEQGVAALTYDKRGTGESAGNFSAVPFMKLADDGLAAVDFLRARTDIDQRRIGVWGLSQGGWLGPLAASRSSNVTFVISVSGPGVSPGEQMIFYYANDLRSRGLSENDVREASALRREVWESLRTGNGIEQARADLNRSRKAAWFNDLKNQQYGLFDRLKTPADWEKARSSIWFKDEIGYDPVPTLEKLAVPALFIFGADDKLVPVPESVNAIKAVSNAGKKNFMLFVVPGADHGLRIATADGDRTISPEYLRHIQEWLAHNVLEAK